MKTSRFITLFLGALMVLKTLSSCSENHTVHVYFDKETPQHVFAADDIERVLKVKDYIVLLKDLSTLDTSTRGEQAYALRTTNQGGQTYWVIGGDANGAMYGGLQIAENISFNCLDGVYNVERYG